MINPARVSAVLVSKGDHDLGEIFDSLEAAGIRDIVVWDNATRPQNLICFGRFAGIADAKHQWIYVQDDDLVAPVGEILKEFSPRGDRRRIVANNRADEDWRLLGLGSVFHRSMADCFASYLDRYGMDEEFLRTADVVFAYQWPYRQVTLGYRELEWSRAPDRMYHQPDHMAVRERTLGRVNDLL